MFINILVNSWIYLKKIKWKYIKKWQLKLELMEWEELEEWLFDQLLKKNKKIIIKHINNRSSSETCSNLLKYDSIHGKFNANLNFNKNYLKLIKKNYIFSIFKY